MTKIDLYSDIVCPWCVIGQHRLDKVLRERFPDLEVDIVHHPYELQPFAPPEGFRLDEYFRQKGITDMSVAFARPEAEARASGLNLSLSLHPYVYRTVHAHTLLRHARKYGTQHALSWALMQAFFFESQNISKRDVLIAIATRHGFSDEEAGAILDNAREQAATEAEIAASRIKGVNSVPTFNFDGVVIVGGRSEDEIAAAIERGITTSQAPH